MSGPLDGDLFGDGEDERTIAIPAVYDLRTRFTGRRSALDLLTQRFRTAVAEPALAAAIIVAEPGMGKSRLVSELAKACRDVAPDVRILTGAADDGGGSFAAFARLLAQRFGIAPGSPPQESRERLIAGVADVLPPARVTEVAHLLAHLMRIGFDDSPVVGPLVESPQQLETRTFLAMRRFLAADAEQHPLVLVLENLELAGPETINLVKYLAAGLRSSRILLVTTAQASLYERYPTFGEGDVAPEKIELGPLSPMDADALLRELLLPLGTVPDRLLAHARSLGGSPRAIHELVRLLLESDCIVRGPGATWRLDDARLAATDLPRTYEQLVAARLGVMDPVDRRVLEMAAVVGEVCWMDAVLALERASHLETTDPDGPTLSQIAASGDHSRVTVNASLAKLIEREWLTEVDPPQMQGERELRFAYPILWSLVHKSIDEAARRRYHE